MIVPFDKRLRQKEAQLPPLPDEEWAMMAAAQMHSEGRLVITEQNDAPTKTQDKEETKLLDLTK